MNKDQIEGKWTQAKGKIKEVYSKLGDTDFALLAEGKKDQFAGRVQELYGEGRDEMDKKLKGTDWDQDWSGCGCSSTDSSCSSKSDKSAA